VYRLQRTARTLLGVLLASLVGATAMAQWQSPEPDDVSIKVTAFDLKPIRFDDTYPDLEGFSSSGKDAWLRLLVEYTVEIRADRANKYRGMDSIWLNNVEFAWNVVLAPVGSSGGNYDDRRAIRLTKVVSYTNVKLGKRKYYAMAFIEPHVLQRYAEKIKIEDIFTQLAVRVDRKTREEMVAKGTKFGTSASERNSLTGRGRRGSLFESEDIIRPGFGLLSRKETPWAWSAYDALETIQDTATGLPQP
jgi:hypothetical protein